VQTQRLLSQTQRQGRAPNGYFVKPNGYFVAPSGYLVAPSRFFTAPNRWVCTIFRPKWAIFAYKTLFLGRNGVPA